MGQPNKNQAMDDGTFTVVDGGDNTKAMAFQCSSITTGNTRTVTVPDKDGTMAMTSDITSGSWTEIASGQLSAASATLFDVSGISTSYDVFKITMYQVNISSASRVAWLRLNNDSGSNYTYQSLFSTSTTVTGALQSSPVAQIAITPGVGVAVSEEAQFSFVISKPLTTKRAQISWDGGFGDGATLKTWQCTGSWNNTAAKISRIAIISSDASTIFDPGSFYVIEGKIIT